MQYCCDKCNKYLKTKQGYEIHYQNCTGIQSLECPYCHRLFDNRKAKYKHVHKCICKPQEDPQEDPREDPQEDPREDPQEDPPIVNSQDTIIFELCKNKDTQFISSHITAEEFTEIIRHFDAKNKYDYLQVLNVYYNMLFSIPENKCVKKTNLRSTYSQLHQGGNKWQTHPDHYMYDKLIIDISKSFLNKLNNSDITDPDLQNKIDIICNSITKLNQNIHDDAYRKERQIAKDYLKSIVYNCNK